jgi:hypothetical protein
MYSYEQFKHKKDLIRIGKMKANWDLRRRGLKLQGLGTTGKALR